MTPARKRPAPIKEADWWAELQRLGLLTDPPVVALAADGFTSRDLAKATGLSIETIARRITRLVEAGVVEYAGKRLEADVTGKTCRRPVYRPVKKQQ